MISTAILTLLVGLVAAIAHAMCFTDSTVGGYLPFFLYTLTPTVTYLIGRIKGEIAVVEFLRSKGVAI